MYVPHRLIREALLLQRDRATPSVGRTGPGDKQEDVLEQVVSPDFLTKNVVEYNTDTANHRGHHDNLEKSS